MPGFIFRIKGQSQWKGRFLRLLQQTDSAGEEGGWVLLWGGRARGKGEWANSRLPTWLSPVIRNLAERSRNPIKASETQWEFGESITGGGKTSWLEGNESFLEQFRGSSQDQRSGEHPETSEPSRYLKDLGRDSSLPPKQSRLGDYVICSYCHAQQTNLCLFNCSAD